MNVGATWSYQDLQFHGLSLSGIRTSIAMPQLGFCFDVAQGFPFHFLLKKYFITHGHLDHAAGIPYLISQKAMNSHPPPDFYMPESLVDPMNEIMKLWQKIEKHEYKYHFHGLKGTESIDLNQRDFIRPFPTLHRIDSLGYTYFSRSRKLKAEFQQNSEEEIARKRQQGIEVQDVIERPRVSFTGDTEIEFLFQRDWIRKSQVLILEATYLDDSKTIAQAKKWGHTHLDEILLHLDEIESEKIVVIHTSSRYSEERVLHLLKKKVPARHQERVVLFPAR